MSTGTATAIATLRRTRLLSGALALTLCIPALAPLVVIAFAAISPNTEIWAHLARFVLPEVVRNTVLLVSGVAVLSGMLGTVLAWLTAMCDFPARRFFEWALLLPLAIPAYVLAFVAVGFLDYAGPLQSMLREVFGTSAWFPRIRSLGGAVVVLSLATYPYVYLLARSAFLTQGRRAMEAAQTLGYGRAAASWKVALPMARPWIMAGVALTAMEALADFGAVYIFNARTFTTAIYSAWFGMRSVNTALQLAGVLMVFVLVVFIIERRSRATAHFASARDVSREAPRLTLSQRQRRLACAFASLIFAIAFVLPLIQLTVWATDRITDLDSRYFGFVGRSLLLAGSAAAVIVSSGVLLAYILRRLPSTFSQAVVRLATIGYAVPGTVLAVGVLVPIILLNNVLQDVLRHWLGDSAPVLMFQGTLIAVLFGYLARFLAVGFNPIESGLERITKNIDEAAMSLGVTGTALLRRVHLPLLRTSLATAATLVFVDVMKEMPITLIVRPFGWDTLAIRVFEMTSEGEWERAALPSIAIVLAGLVPVALLTRRGAHVA
jgi:iron(III) transport system permease protein